MILSTCILTFYNCLLNCDVQLKLQKHELNALKVRTILNNGLEELGITSRKLNSARIESPRNNGGDLIVLDDLNHFKLEDVAKLVIDIAISLNANDNSDDSNSKESATVAKNEIEVLRMQLKDAETEVERLKKTTTDATPNKSMELHTLVESNSVKSDPADPADPADVTLLEDRKKVTENDKLACTMKNPVNSDSSLDELYRRERVLSSQLATLHQHLSTSQHNVVVEIKRRQVAEKAMEKERRRRLRYEKRLTTMKRQFTAMHQEYLSETKLREKQLFNLEKVRINKLCSLLISAM